MSTLDQPKHSLAGNDRDKLLGTVLFVGRVEQA